MNISFSVPSHVMYFRFPAAETYVLYLGSSAANWITISIHVRSASAYSFLTVFVGREMGWVDRFGRVQHRSPEEVLPGPKSIKSYGLLEPIALFYRRLRMPSDD